MKALFGSKSATAGAAAFFILLLTGNAEAHSHLIGAAPAPHATVAAPATITLHFSESLEPKFSSFDVKDATGRIVKADVHSEGQDNSVLVASPAAPMGPGAYSVSWHIVARDGHRMQGVYPFTVR
jgi:hypothetical protein